MMSMSKKSSYCSSSFRLSSLPHDVMMSCLARVSRSDLAALSLVSKSYRSLVASSDLYETRSLMGYAKNCLYLCLLTPPDPIPRWFILSRGKLISIPSLPIQPPEASSVVVVDREIYLIGGSIKGKRTKAVRKLDCRTHKWHPVPSMRVARASAAVGVVGGKIYVLGGCGDQDSWAEVFDPNTQTWDSLPLPDQTIRCQYIHDSVVVIKDREEKIYAVNGLDHTFNYSPSESIWGRGTICPHARNRRDWCVVGQLIFSIDGRGNLCWCEPGQLDSEQGEMCWRDVKGLVSLKESLSSSRLVHFDRKFEAMWESYKMKMNRGNRRLKDLLPGARLSYSGPNIVLFWDVIEGDRLDIWCAEISLERQGQDMWGNIEWCNVVMTADHVLDRFKILHSVSVSL